jgi:4-azaleucine resistance transporter AzlC
MEDMNTSFSPARVFWQGVRAEAPILIGVAPFGLIFGVTARAAGIPAWLAQAMSSVIFAGSAQFVTVQLIATGTPVVIIVLTAVLLNLRHVLYSASVAPYLRHLPARWRAWLAYLLTDEAYAVSIVKLRAAPDLPGRQWYVMGAGLALWSSWQASTAVGILLGAQIPAGWSLDFAATLTFIALVVPAITSRAALGCALVAAVVAIVMLHAPLKLGLIAATILGIIVGRIIESRNQEKERAI